MPVLEDIHCGSTMRIAKLAGNLSNFSNDYNQLMTIESENEMLLVSESGDVWSSRVDL